MYDAFECFACGGSGTVTSESGDWGEIEVECPVCEGTGEIEAEDLE